MKLLQRVNKISALYLWWYAFVFVIVIVDLSIPFLPETIKSVLARYPYQWDFEFMFSALFLVWGCFLWKDKQLSRFSGYAFLSQGVAMILLGLFRSQEMIHLFTDSVLWIILGVLLLKQK
ncbi:MAG: hypothetical protein AAB870_03985 [Patescibacteria group bacterium]